MSDIKDQSFCILCITERVFLIVFWEIASLVNNAVNNLCCAKQVVFVAFWMFAWSKILLLLK